MGREDSVPLDTHEPLRGLETQKNLVGVLIFRTRSRQVAEGLAR